MNSNGLFYADRHVLSPETFETVVQVNMDLQRVRREVLAAVKVTLDMPDTLMLAILEARLHKYKTWYPLIEEGGGPSPGRLDSYIRNVLAGKARRVIPRIREILVMMDQGIEPYLLPERGPSKFHPGSPPDHTRWRAARKAKAAAAAAAAASVRPVSEAPAT